MFHFIEFLIILSVFVGSISVPLDGANARDKGYYLHHEDSCSYPRKPCYPRMP